jgi:hypothetical protein
LVAHSTVSKAIFVCQDTRQLIGVRIQSTGTVGRTYISMMVGVYSSLCNWMGLHFGYCTSRYKYQHFGHWYSTELQDCATFVRHSVTYSSQRAIHSRFPILS